MKNHSFASETEEQKDIHSSQPGSGSVIEQYPYSNVAKLLDSQIAHNLLKYGIETFSFAAINLVFPKRTSWFLRVALPLSVNYLLGRWIEKNYNEWVASLANQQPVEKVA
ncbi:hypothetical protein [Xanthocytophaga agilis]|uniref:Uncharacterized protein n=1 Tax=Xanthocytophaga agilis TaxID=3048010 RepID=A0AAE3R9H3_9BACT|nr:hypothetical protein [Xanthocytophaga agilis]MDJ1503949.1 hypothetical protein [Xanthocytophaga agilis]